MSTQNDKPSGLVLVIDDDASIRFAISEILNLENLQVIEAADGVTGITLYLERRAEVDLILLDLVMSGISGQETFRRLRQHNPDVKVLLLSGVGEFELTNKLLKEGLSGFIQKPFTMHSLIEAVWMYIKQEK